MGAYIDNTSDASLKMGHIGSMCDSQFTSNQITSEYGNIYGGIFYTTGLDAPLEITNTIMQDNTLVAANGQLIGGAILVDLGGNSGKDPDRETAGVTLSVAADQHTHFYRSGSAVNGYTQLLF